MASSSSPATATAAVVGPEQATWMHYIQAMQALQQQNNILQTQVTNLQTKVAKLERKLVNATFPKKNPDGSNDTDPLIPLSKVVEFLIAHGGASRFTLVHDDWHAKHPKAANQLFGFKSWQETKECIHRKFPKLDMSPPPIFLTKENTLTIRKETSGMEKCLCIKLMDRVGFSVGRAGVLYGVNERTVGHWRKVWISKWGLDTVQVFQSMPMTGPSAVKKRKLIQGSSCTEKETQSEPPNQEETQPGPPDQNDATEAFVPLLLPVEAQDGQV